METQQCLHDSQHLAHRITVEDIENVFAVKCDCWTINNETWCSAVTSSILQLERIFYGCRPIMAVCFARVSFLSYHNPSFTNVSSINTQNLYSSLSRLVCMVHNNYAWSHLELAFTGDLTSPSHASAIKDSLNPSHQVRSQVPIHSKEALRKWICICDGDSKSPCTASVLWYRWSHVSFTDCMGFGNFAWLTGSSHSFCCIFQAPKKCP